MKIYSNGQTIEIPIQGSSGSDQIPVGTVISFMGTKAPEDYLVCDGAQYAISDYPALASAFREQFGISSYFGGDGENTFAVPDLRNLFLRGYHGDGEALSGDIGKVQAGTNIPWTETTSTSANFPKYGSKQEPVHFDKRTSARSNGVWYTTEADDAYKIAYSDFTARPVNMAVLYCVKAVERISAGGGYSTRETRIGTWIDGKPLYRRVIETAFPDTADKSIAIAEIPAGVRVIRYDVYPEDNRAEGWLVIPLSCYVGPTLKVWGQGNEWMSYVSGTYKEWLNVPIHIMFEYTKETEA